MPLRCRIGSQACSNTIIIRHLTRRAHGWRTRRALQAKLEDRRDSVIHGIESLHRPGVPATPLVPPRAASYSSHERTDARLAASSSAASNAAAAAAATAAADGAQASRRGVAASTVTTVPPSAPDVSGSAAAARGTAGGMLHLDASTISAMRAQRQAAADASQLNRGLTTEGHSSK